MSDPTTPRPDDRRARSAVPPGNRPPAAGEATSSGRTPSPHPSHHGFPAPPWRTRGELWVSLLTTRQALPLPGDLTPVGHHRALILVLARHTAGTLDYDELAMGTAARRGRRLGLYCHRIWVSSMTSVRGGRHLWGIPKELAHFTWTGRNVRIMADTGPVATVRLGRSCPWRIPAGRLPGHGFGQIGARRLFLPGRISGQLGLSRVTVTQWGDTLPSLARTTPFLSLSVSPASFTFPQAITLGRAVDHTGAEGGT